MFVETKIIIINTLVEKIKNTQDQQKKDVYLRVLKDFHKEANK